MLNMTDFMSLRHANGIRTAASYLVALALYMFLRMSVLVYSIKTYLGLYHSATTVASRR